MEEVLCHIKWMVSRCICYCLLCTKDLAVELQIEWNMQAIHLNPILLHPHRLAVCGWSEWLFCIYYNKNNKNTNNWLDLLYIALSSQCIWLFPKVNDIFIYIYVYIIFITFLIVFSSAQPSFNSLNASMGTYWLVLTEYWLSTED